MKKQLFLFIAITTALASNAQNLIQNEGFDEKVETVLTNPNKGDSGKWFIINNVPNKDTNKFQVVENSDADYGGVMQITNTAPASWYKTFIAQRIQNTEVERDIYTLSFDVMGTKKNATISVYIKQTAEEKNPATNKHRTTFFTRCNYNSDKHPLQSGAAFTQKLGKANKWTSISVDYDFGQVINTISSKKAVGDGLQIVDLDKKAAILSDFFVAIYATSKNQTIQIDNVKLVKKRK